MYSDQRLKPLNRVAFNMPKNIYEGKLRIMKFAELLTKITLAGENQTPSESKMLQGAEIAHKAAEQNLSELEYEAGIVCRVINGNKVKKRKVKQESELSEIAEK